VPRFESEVRVDEREVFARLHSGCDRENKQKLGSLCIGVQFSWRAIGVGLLSMLSVRYWGLGPVKESTG
jgi:hypothetical protein